MPTPVIDFTQYEDAPESERKFSSTQVNLPKDVADKIRAFGKRTIPKSALAADGYEEDPHITVKYGLHGADASKVAELLKDEHPIKLQLLKTGVFKNVEDGTADAVIVKVDSPDLHRMNAKIATLPHTDTHPKYLPHLTLAYVKPGLGQRYADNKSLAGQSVTIDKIIFSGKDKKETEIPLGGPSSNIAKFIDVLKKRLLGSIAKNPGQYRYGPEKAGDVAKRLTEAAAKGKTQTDTETFRNAAKDLGIKPGGIREFLNA